MSDIIKTKWELGYYDRGMGRGSFGILAENTKIVIIPELNKDLAEHIINSHNESLTQQLESGRKDAERYRWMRDSGRYRPSYYGWDTDVVGNRKFSKEELDAAVDKAMKESK